MPRRGLGDRIELEQHSSQQLTDLVVQVAGDPDTFGLLRGEHAPGAPLALALETVEHVVEGAHYSADLIVAADPEALSGAQQVDRVHPLGQAHEWRDCAPQEEGVGRHGDREPGDYDQHLCERRRRLDRYWGDDQQ
jgi:hypothetical protein